MMPWVKTKLTWSISTSVSTAAIREREKMLGIKNSVRGLCIAQSVVSMVR